MLSLTSSSLQDTPAMQSGAHASVRVNCPSRNPLDPHARRTEAAYAICVLAAGVLLLFTAF